MGSELTLALALAVAIGLSLGVMGSGGSIVTLPVLVYVAGIPAQTAAAKLQPKASVAFGPWVNQPLRLFYNYGRGIASMDARGVVRRPDSPHVSTTDFNQWGLQHTVADHWTFMTDFFLIHQSNQIVYIPDDGTIEFSDPSQSHGFEVRTALDLNSKVSVNGGVTKVLKAFFRNTKPRIYVDSTPHFVADGAVTLADWRGWTGSLRMRVTSGRRRITSNRDSQVKLLLRVSTRRPITGEPSLSA